MPPIAALTDDDSTGYFCIFQENGEKQISVEEDTPPGKMTPDKRFTKDC